VRLRGSETIAPSKVIGCALFSGARRARVVGDWAARGGAEAPRAFESVRFL